MAADHLYRTDSKGQPVEVFEEACANLLKEILRTAGLLQADHDTQAQKPKSLAILDLGFGCGDQTFELVRLTEPPGGWDSFRYVGLTLNLSQLQTASRHVSRELRGSNALSNDSFKLFCADAARPDTWNAQATKAVESLADPDFKEPWLLALDCLYHFQPSRKPVFSYAANKIGANVMAFDLLLNEKAPWRDVWRARLVCIIMRCPVKAFKTEAEYRAELIECGYAPDKIEIKDISSHVFEPVSGFLDHQERALSQYGVSMGGYKLAGRIFRWFGRSRVVKAVIVVARRPDTQIE
jgi:hypothetical protein